jgi:small subunit ribosomal protein S17
MAEETPDNIVEEVQSAAAGAAPDVDEAAAAGAAPDVDEAAAAAAAPETAADAAETPAAPPPPPGQTRRERLEARRAARRPAQRGPLTADERDAERRARRAETAKQRRRYRAKLKQRRDATRTEQPPAEVAHAPEHGPGRPKTRQGVVVSAKPDKTIVVEINVVQRHRRYRKILRSTIKLVAHDEANTANAGDTVRVVECRPMSRTKRWRLTDVLERAR